MATDTYSVSYITNTMRGAPVLKGSSDGSASFIDILDALLINGWGLAAASTLIVADGIATATFASATPWEVGAVIEVEGATPIAINGRARVLTSSGNALTFATSAGDGSYGGAIGIKYAPAGWQKVFQDPQKAVYRSLDVQGIRHYYRMDESIAATQVRVCGAESMDGIDSAVGLFNQDAVLSDPNSYIRKSEHANTVGVPYVFAADARAVLHYISYMAVGMPGREGGALRGFGDAVAFAPAGDAWCSFLSCPSTDTGGCLGTSGMASSSWRVVMPRAANGTEGRVYVRPRALVGGWSQFSGADKSCGAAPMAINGKMLLSRMVFATGDVEGGPIRAGVPGVVYVPHTATQALLPHRSVHEGAGAWTGRRLMALPCAENVWITPSSYGVVMLDLTGPWRDWSLA